MSPALLCAAPAAGGPSSRTNSPRGPGPWGTSVLPPVPCPGLQAVSRACRRPRLQPPDSQRRAAQASCLFSRTGPTFPRPSRPCSAGRGPREPGVGPGGTGSMGAEGPTAPPRTRWGRPRRAPGCGAVVWSGTRGPRLASHGRRRGQRGHRASPSVRRGRECAPPRGPRREAFRGLSRVPQAQGHTASGQVTSRHTHSPCPHKHTRRGRETETETERQRPGWDRGGVNPRVSPAFGRKNLEPGLLASEHAPGETISGFSSQGGEEVLG